MRNKTIGSPPQTALALPPLRVAAYCFAKTDWDGYGPALEAEMAHYTAKIESDPKWIMAGLFVDAVRSNTPMENREGYQRMLQRCRQGEIDLILTKSLSRFARNTVDVLKYTRELRDLGVTVIFEKQDINTAMPEIESIIALYDAFARSEAASISSRICIGCPRGMKSRWPVRGWIAAQFLKRGDVVYLWKPKGQLVKNLRKAGGAQR